MRHTWLMLEWIGEDLADIVEIDIPLPIAIGAQTVDDLVSCYRVHPDRHRIGPIIGVQPAMDRDERFLQNIFGVNSGAGASHARHKSSDMTLQVLRQQSQEPTIGLLTACPRLVHRDRQFSFHARHVNHP
jgi:hypothetical protein